MKKLIVSLILLALLLGSCATIAVQPTPGEQVDVIITAGDSYVVGTVTYPADLSEPVPAVLLLPGFMGERDELPVTGTFSMEEGEAPWGCGR